MSDKDLFDNIMKLPVLKLFEAPYRAHKEVLLYLLFGGLSFVMNIVLFFLLHSIMHINELIANVICWIACVLFQYITNRTWVFDGKTKGVSEFIWQVSSFFGGRLFTLAVEEAIIAIFITWQGFNSIIVKIAAQIVVIVLNYVISKRIVFKNRTNSSSYEKNK